MAVWLRVLAALRPAGGAIWRGAQWGAAELYYPAGAALPAVRRCAEEREPTNIAMDQLYDRGELERAAGRSSRGVL